MTEQVGADFFALVLHDCMRCQNKLLSLPVFLFSGRINSDGVVGLTRAFLAAGAQCVLFCLWPVPEMAAKILLKTFYTALLKVTG